MSYLGYLNQMNHIYESPIKYILPLGEEEVLLNEYLGQMVTIRFTGDIECTHCGRKIKKTYEGHCYPCFISLPQTDLCIVKPHECHFDSGTCRDPEFAHTHCMIPHYVYLAISSFPKVGLTRKNNEWKRWTNQGAVYAIPIAELPTRKKAGELEYILSQHLADKTNWRKMLKGDIDPHWLQEENILALRDQMVDKFPDEFKTYALNDNRLYEFVYPILESLEKIKTYNLDKEPVIEDKLIGIKGNYLIFENAVLNVRKYTGYKIMMNAQ